MIDIVKSGKERYIDVYGRKTSEVAIVESVCRGVLRDVDAVRSVYSGVLWEEVSEYSGVYMIPVSPCPVRHWKIGAMQMTNPIWLVPPSRDLCGYKLDYR